MNIRFKSWLVAFAASAFVYSQAFAQDIATGLKQLDGNQACLAKETFEKLATATPSADNQFYLGYYYLRTKQPDLAKEAFEKGLAADLKSKENLNKVGLGAVALAKGDRTGAQTIFAEILKATKNKNIEVLQRISEAYTGYVVVDSMKPIYKTTDPAQAVTLADIAIALMLKSGAKNQEVYMAKGDAFYIKGEAGPAVSAYEDAINANPSLGKAFTKIAKIYWGGRNYELAQTNFKKAIEVDPDYGPANKEYAELFFYVRQYKPASRYMDAYVEKLGVCASDDEVLRSAQFNFVAEEFAKVNTKIAKVMSSGRTSDVLYRMQGWAAYKENQYEKAIQNLKKFIQQAPQKAIDNDYRYLGNSMLRISPVDTAAAIANLEKAAEMDRDVLGLAQRLAARVEQGGRAVAPLLDVGRMRSADQRLAGLVDDRGHGGADHLDGDGIDGGAGKPGCVAHAPISRTRFRYGSTRAVMPGRMTVVASICSTMAGPAMRLPFASLSRA